MEIENVQTAESRSLEQSPVLKELTAKVVEAYVSNNIVVIAELPELIKTVHGLLSGLGHDVAAPSDEQPLVPAVPIKKSITPDYLICLEDGKHFKSLKRHLATKFAMTPDDYRRKWGLPKDYPMVAPNYSINRSSLAVKLGLGRRAGQTNAARAKKGV